VRRLGLVLLALVALAGALYGSAHLLTGSSGFARAVVWGESDIEDRHRFPARAIQAGGDDWPLPRAPRASGCMSSSRSAPRGRSSSFTAGAWSTSVTSTAARARRSPARLGHLLENRLQAGRASDSTENAADRALLLAHVLKLTAEVGDVPGDASHSFSLGRRRA